MNVKIRLVTNSEGYSLVSADVFPISRKTARLSKNAVDALASMAAGWKVQSVSTLSRAWGRG